jgi:hypothetical protein
MRTLVALGTLVVFTVLSVILLKHHLEEIPQRDLYTSSFLFAWCVVGSGVSELLARERLKTPSPAVHRQHSPRPSDFSQASNRLMQLEVFGTLVAPWMFLRSSPLVERYLLLSSDVVEHLLVPHLYFFLAQVAAEAIIFATHQDRLMLPYTCVANALRGLPLGTWILRSLVATVESIDTYNPFHWLIVVGLPAVAAALWLYSSLVFIPLIWYPVTKTNEGVGGGHQY